MNEWICDCQLPIWRHRCIAHLSRAPQEIGNRQSEIGDMTMDTFWQDFKYGIRTLIRNPGFTVIAVMTLALGLGVNTAIFSLTDQILLRLLPVENPSELVVLRSPGPKQGRVWSDGDNASPFSYPLYKEVRDNNNVFSGVLARFAVSLSVAGEGQTERANGELVSGNYFEVLGVRPVLGRVLTQDDDQVAGAGQV